MKVTIDNAITTEMSIQEFESMVKSMVFQKTLNKCNSIKNTYIKRKKMLKEFIDQHKEENVYFATFTINNKYINNMKLNKNRLSVYLQNQKIKYILVKEYGDKNNREHYHGLIASNRKLNPSTLYKFGYVFLKKINNLNEKVINYILKYTIKQENKQRILKSN